MSPDHTLLIPKRHVEPFFSLSASERFDIIALLDRAKLKLDNKFKTQAYNIGVNDGSAAGQTVPHLHVHIIQRYEGNILDPRGGLRWVIPSKVKY